MGACKVFLVGEGSSDSGDLANEPVWRDRKHPVEGFLQPILRRLVPTVDLEFEGRQLLTLANGEDDAPFDVPSALAAKAGKALAFAGLDEARVLVLVTDVDREHARKRSAHEARRQVVELRGNIEAGFAMARERTPELTAVTTLVATPLRMLEAWALGDPAALPRHAKPAVSRPEELWGAKRDPKSNFPKHVLKRALGHDPSAADFSELAERIDLDALRANCPISFAPFAEEVTVHAKCCQASLASPPLPRRSRLPKKR